MARRQQDDLGPVGGLGPDRRPCSAARLRLGGPEVEPGERVERLAERRGVGRDERRELVEDALDLLLLGDLRLAPGVAELDRDERLDEERLAAARRVVDDALDPRPRLGLDRHDVAPVAERDDRLLERAAQLRADERVEAPAQPVVGDADRGPQAAEPRRGGVEQLADRVEAARERAAQRGQRVERRGRGRAAAAGARRRATSRSRAVASSVSAISRNCAGIEPAAARGALDRRPDVVRRADADARPLARAARGPGRSRRAPRATITGSADGSRASARRRDGAERGRLGQPLADERELEQDAASGLSIAASARRADPDTDGDRRSRTATDASAQSGPA